MKQVWTERYREASKLAEGETVDVMTAFSANIDVIYDMENLDLDLNGVRPQEFQEVENIEEMKSVLKLCIEKGYNREKILDFDPGLDGGKERVGGQAAIMANFLSRMGEAVTFYTPLLSQELADKIDERVLFPAEEGGFVLKNVRDAANSNRTKKNLIFQYSGKNSGRVIFSSKIPGFGPFFRREIEENFPLLDSSLERVLLSGFHNVEGNRVAKMEKAEEQLRKLETPKHLEFVYKDRERAELVRDHVFDQVESIGLDEDEAGNIADLLDLEMDLGEEISLGEAYQIGKELIDRFGMERVHFHTYGFHAAITTTDYPVGTGKIRDAMLYGELAAINTCEKGEFPEELGLEMDDKHLEGLGELEDFQEFFDLESFVETGTADVEGYKIAAIPTIIHEEPKRLVGLGDVISAGAFTGELK